MDSVSLGALERGGGGALFRRPPPPLLRVVRPPPLSLLMAAVESTWIVGGDKCSKIEFCWVPLRRPFGFLLRRVEILVTIFQAVC